MGPCALWIQTSLYRTSPHPNLPPMQRSTSCFVQDLLSASEVQLPASWGPAAWLLMLCELYLNCSDGLLGTARGMVSEGDGSGAAGRLDPATTAPQSPGSAYWSQHPAGEAPQPPATQGGQSVGCM